MQYLTLKEILLLAVLALIIIAITTLAVRKCISSRQIKTWSIKRLVYTLKLLLLAYLFKITLIYFFALNTNFLLDYLFCTIPVHLVRLKILSLSRISCCIIFSIILFYVKFELAELITIMAVFLPSNVTVMCVNDVMKISSVIDIGQTECVKTYNLLLQRTSNWAFDFAPYNERNKEDIGKLYAIIHHEKFNLKKTSISQATLSESGHEFLKQFIRDRDTKMYEKVYVNIREGSRRTPGIGGTIKVNYVFKELEKVCDYKLPK